MKIRDIMRPGAFSTTPTTPLQLARAQMRRSRIRHLPVIDDGKLVGMLSERDIFAARSRVTDSDWRFLTVHNAMTKPVHSAHADDPVAEVAARMASEKIGAMPVVAHGRLVGFATTSDVLDGLVRDAMSPGPAHRLTAADAMTAYPIVVRADAPLAEAIARMLAHHIRHLPVLDEDGTLVGMLSERDVRLTIGDPSSFIEEGERPRVQRYVRDAMSRPPIAVPFDRPLAEIARIFRDEKIGAVPVLDSFGALVGIVSYVDVLQLVAA